MYQFSHFQTPPKVKEVYVVWYPLNKKREWSKANSVVSAALCEIMFFPVRDSLGPRI